MFGRRRFGRRRPPCYPVPREEEERDGMLGALRSTVDKAASLLGLGPNSSGPGGDNEDIIINGEPIPPQLLAEIFKRVDDNLTVGCICPLVCRRWNEVLTAPGFWADYMRHRSRPLPPPILRNNPLLNMKKACLKQPFGRNLIQNPSGEAGFTGWDIKEDGGERIQVERPPVNCSMNLEEDIPVAFATSYGWGHMVQVVDLWKRGIEPAFLDTYRPPIKVSESYNCRKDCAAVYLLRVKLVSDVADLSADFHYWNEVEWGRMRRPHMIEHDEDTTTDTVITRLRHMEQWTAAEWHRMEHTFDSYPKGVRYVVFGHAGKDSQFWAGHYGSKMANASVVVEYGDGVEKKSGKSEKSEKSEKKSEKSEKKSDENMEI